MKPFLPIQTLRYQRTFEVPASWRSERVWLHFDAVDWEAQVWVNETKIGEHRGGYDRFGFDVTGTLIAGENSLRVEVKDATNSGERAQIYGKQTLHPAGAAYTASSGIWQSVWLEPVPAAHIAHLEITPDVAASAVKIRIESTLAGEVSLEVRAGEVVVARAAGRANEALTLALDDPRLWSPASPFLYDLEAVLRAPDGSEDRVQSYFGMRSIEVVPDENGVPRIWLNGETIFQAGPLDQGFWSDGLHTPPCDEAIVFDLQFLVDAGFNMVRKHLKIESDRWYYHADRLGLLVWQDMPSGQHLASAEQQAQWIDETRHHIRNHFNCPSIVVWVAFNEGWGQFDTGANVARIRRLDATRLITDASGWYHKGWGDLIDSHFYPGPRVPVFTDKRANVTGEFGGLGLVVPAHVWRDDVWGYHALDNADELSEIYRRLWRRVYDLAISRGLCAAVYTQISDVEQEANGLLTYDREVEKIGREALHAANSGQLVPATYAPLLASPTWKFTTEQPQDSWMEADFEDSNWQIGEAPFGSKFGLDELQTEWMTTDLWLRQTFEVGADGARWPVLRMFYGVDSNVYVNGIKACAAEGFQTSNGFYELTIEARRSVVAGENVIAVHVAQRFKSGTQIYDVTLLDESDLS